MSLCYDVVHVCSRGMVTSDCKQLKTNELLVVNEVSGISTWSPLLFTFMCLFCRDSYFIYNCSCCLVGFQLLLIHWMGF